MSKPALAAAELDLSPLAGAALPVRFTARERHQARRLFMVLTLISVFFCVQLAGAIWANSDVLRVEALHLLTDVAALGMAFIAMRVAVRRPTARFTFGLRRAEPVTAIFNALMVLVATAFLVVEAVRDLGGDGSPRADRMLYIAGVGLIVNSVAAWLIHGAIGTHAGHDHHTGHDHHGAPAGDHYHGAPPDESQCGDHSHRHIAQHAHHRGHGHSLNLRGAWLHLFGDALGSLAALLAALAIRLGFSSKVDPIAAFVVAAILVYGAVCLLRDAVLILLEASPGHLEVGQVRREILETPGVAELHDLHVWTLGAGHDAITAHVSADHADPSLARRIERGVRHRFHVEYVTIQVEVGGVTCQGEALEN